MPTEEEKQGPGGFVNFQSYFNANKSASDASAKRYADQAKQAGQNAYGAVNNAMGQFKAASAAAANPTSNVGAGATPQGYAGPGAITDNPNYGQTAQTVQTAEQQLNGLGLVGKGGLDANGVPRGDLSTLTAKNNASRGANNFSANLIGSAGRQQFDALRAYFQPGKALNKAVTGSAEIGDKARADYDKAAEAQRQAQAVGGSAGRAVQSNAGTVGVGPLNKPTPTIPDSITTVDQAIAAGYSQDQIVAKFGYGAYSDSVGNAFGRG